MYAPFIGAKMSEMSYLKCQPIPESLNWKYIVISIYIMTWKLSIRTVSLS